MSNHTIHLHALSPESVIVDMFQSATPMANPDSADGFVFYQTLETLGASVRQFYSDERVGQVMVRGAIESMQAHSTDLLDQAGRIASEGARRSGMPHETRRAHYSELLHTFVGRSLMAVGSDSKLAAVLPSFIVPMADDLETIAHGLQPDGIEDPRIAQERREDQIAAFHKNINAGSQTRHQIMRVIRPSVA